MLLEHDITTEYVPEGYWKAWLKTSPETQGEGATKDEACQDLRERIAQQERRDYTTQPLQVDEDRDERQEMTGGFLYQTLHVLVGMLTMLLFIQLAGEILQSGPVNLPAQLIPLSQTVQQFSQSFLITPVFLVFTGLIAWLAHRVYGPFNLYAAGCMVAFSTILAVKLIMRSFPLTSGSWSFLVPAFLLLVPVVVFCLVMGWKITKGRDSSSTRPQP